MPGLPEFTITDADVAAIAASEGLVLDDEDRIAVLTSQESIDVQACPGSGKTTLIAAKLMLLSQRWPSEQQGVCVLSHTNVAKDQIIDRLVKSNVVEARRLLAYPHFIGTIQEFVNRFLALPHLRSEGVSDFTIDNDEYVKVARRLLDRGEFAWLRGTLNGLGNVENQDGFLRSTFRVNDTEINISRRPPAWRQPQNLQRAKRALSQLKAYLEERGFFLFRDMYTHAQIAVSQNDSVTKSLVTRFPYLFTDEMQDTQRFQDELLRSVFSPGPEGSIVQRFGDPDQAIFHGIGNEEPNESFNGKSRDEMDFVINKSHRFDGSLATKIKPLSLNEVPLETELTDESLRHRAEFYSSVGPLEHAVIVFDDETRARVIEQFAQIVSDEFTNDTIHSDKFSVKVIGAVGNEIDPARDELKIGHYWGDYDKSKSKTSFKENTLIEAVRYCQELSDQDWAPSYRLFFDCILRLLRSANIRDENDRYFSASKLREKLIADGNWQNLREGVFLVLSGSVPLDQEVWENFCSLIKQSCGIADDVNEIEGYLSFEAAQADVVAQDEEGDGGQVLETLRENRIRHQSGFEIQLSTIHGVKGETHDATLVLETKNYTFDLETMLPYLTGELPSDDRQNINLPEKPHATRAFKPNRVFMRQLYVAASRPKHLLCLALHSERFRAADEQALRDRGWRIERL